MKTQIVPNSEPDQHLVRTTEPKLQFYFGLIGGIPLPKEMLALIALKRLYVCREQIVQEVALKFGLEFINEARELTQALLIAEQLLNDAGISTELDKLDEADPENRYTFLQVADDVLQHSATQPASETRMELLAAVNKQFRPWINQPNAAATPNKSN